MTGNTVTVSIPMIPLVSIIASWTAYAFYFVTNSTLAYKIMILFMLIAVLSILVETWEKKQ